LISRTHSVARRLRELRADASARAAQGVLVAEGRHLALEALEARAPIELAVISDRLGSTEEGAAIEARLQHARIEIHRASDATMDALQDAKSPQPVVLIVKHALRPVSEVMASNPSALVAVACGVQDPGNLGAIARTAWAAGATGLAAASGGADPLHPRAVRATMGAIFRLPVASGSLAEILAAARTAGVAVVGAAAGGGLPYDAFDWTKPLALLLGAEGAGLPGDVELDARVSIPMAPGVESLSVAAAAAVLLFAAARARGALSSGE
jgi:TrmH family RNA methyltransferase